MTHHPDNDAGESWSVCRRAFAHRAAHIPELSLIPRLIDRLVELGVAASFYASSSLDNLVISNTPNWRKRMRGILVIPKKSTVELRYYRHGELVEQSEVGSEQVYEELDRLLPRLLRDDSSSSDVRQ